MSKAKKIAITSIVGVLVLGFLVCMLGFILLAGYIASNENAHKELAKDGRSCVPMAPPDGNPYQEKFQAAAARGQAPSGGDGKYVVPMAGVITSPYGRRDNPLGTGGDADDALNFHRGVDIAGVPEGTPFYAAASGTVKSVDYGGPDGGNGIIISGDDGVEYWYWHAATGTSKVRQGQHVEAGTELAGAGQTGLASGVHLHFEIHVNGQHTDPVPFMKERGITLGQGGDQSGGGQHKDGGGDKKEQKKQENQSVETVSANGGRITWSPEQMKNAATIVSVAKQRGLSERGMIIALMTALQESTLNNLDHGDRDSVGLFQQRPSQGWGSKDQIMNPEYATNAFIGGQKGEFHQRGLLDVKGWESLELGEAAQQVQRSAYPAEYTKWEATAREIYEHVKDADGHGVVGLTLCDSESGKKAVASHGESSDQNAQAKSDEKKEDKKDSEAAPSPSGEEQKQEDGQHKDGDGDKKPAKSRPLTSEERQRVLETAASGVGDGSTYRQGGNDFKSWDASGYVQWVYRQAGVNLPRTHQWEYGVKVDSPEPGDLVVQVPDGDGWAHVGIYAGDGKMYSALNSEDGTLLHSVDWTDSAQYYRLSAPDEGQ